ncbi:MAG: tetratricopeptide repeat protein [Caulobacterales bacterium]
MSRRDRRRQHAIASKAPAPIAARALHSVVVLAAAGRNDEARAALTDDIHCGRIAGGEIVQNFDILNRLSLSQAAIVACGAPSASADFSALMALGRRAMSARAFSDAALLFEKAVALTPQDAEANALLGVSLYQSARALKAREALERAVTLDPNHVLARNNLGSLLLKMGHIDEAIASLSIAVARAPDNANAKLNLAEAFIKKEMYQEAFLLAQSTLDAAEVRERAFLVLSNIYRALCDIEKTVYYLKQAVDVSESGDSVTPYLFFLQASDTCSDDALFAEHKRLAQAFERRAPKNKRHANNPNPERRLKIGFVSGDLYNHSVANFITPLFRDLDRSQFEVYALYNNAVSDTTSIVLRELSDHWLNCMGMSDDALAQWIEKEEIDVLIDLSGHTGMHRLSTFGLKPAPVQATYLGYPGTTGMTTMDYRITCESLDPTGVTERQHTEKLVRLPGIFAPFQPPVSAPIADMPSLSGAPFTFACLNPIWRINASVVACWARILNATEGSRMMIGNVDTPMIAHRITSLFAAEGIGTHRLILQRRQNLHDYLKLHHSIDLGLDTFPYNGGTTTTYSLWMGVPVVALEGTRASSRTGAGILREADLEDFIARTPEDYVALAIGWASRRDELQALRHGARGRLKIGRIEDQAQAAAEFGAALRGMWREWCAETQSAGALRATG